MFNIINKFSNTADKEIDINDEINEEEVIENEEVIEDEGNDVDTQTDENDRIDENVEDENNVKRKYVISVDGIPFYYHNDLETVRKCMWSMGNNYITPNEDDDNTDEYCITTNNINHIKIMKTYDFYFFKYSSIVNELKIDYVLPCN